MVNLTVTKLNRNELQIVVSIYVAFINKITPDNKLWCTSTSATVTDFKAPISISISPFPLPVDNVDNLDLIFPRCGHERRWAKEGEESSGSLLEDR